MSTEFNMFITAGQAEDLIQAIRNAFKSVDETGDGYPIVLVQVNLESFEVAVGTPSHDEPVSAHVIEAWVD